MSTEAKLQRAKDGKGDKKVKSHSASLRKRGKPELDEHELKTGRAEQAQADGRWTAVPQAWGQEDPTV